MRTLIGQKILLLSLAAALTLAPRVNHAANSQPTPPSEVCVDAQCVKTPTNPTAGIKWHPGHYMDSNIFTNVGNIDNSGQAAGPEKAAEISVLRAGPTQVLGWEGYYFWRSFEDTAAGSYNFGGTSCPSTSGSGFDCDYIAVTGYVSGTTTRAVYNNPRRMAVYILNTDYFSASVPGRAVPTYITTSSVYGNGPSGGSPYGWYTNTGSGGCGTGSTVALWRANVMAREQALMSAIANHVLPDGYTVDTSPYIEWIKPYLETASLVPQKLSGSTCLYGGSADGSYSDSGVLTQLEALQSTGATVFAHTNFGAQSNWLNTSASLSTLARTFSSRRTGSSGPDIFGYSSGQGFGNGLSQLTPGQCAYVGLTVGNSTCTPGGTDLRGTVPYLGTVQGTELISCYGTYYTPRDIYRQADTYGTYSLHATHIAWNYITNAVSHCPGSPTVNTSANWFGSATSLANWTAGGDTWSNADGSKGGVLTNITTYPVRTTACPISYAGGCNTN